MKLINSVLSVGIVLFLFIAIFGESAAAQRFSIRTADGYLFVQNGKELSFTCEVKGKSIEPLKSGENPAFMADGTLVQMLWVENKNYDPTGKVEVSKLLGLHQNWEITYLESVFEAKLISETENLVVETRPTLFWSFSRPKHTTEYDRDTFMTTLVGSDIFGINIPVKIGVNLKTPKEKMLEVMKSLKISKTPFDIKKLSEEIKKGSQLET